MAKTQTKQKLESNMPAIQSFLLVILVISGGLGFLFYQLTASLLNHYDAVQYQGLATAIATGGGPFNIEASGLRGFFYPTILAITQLLGSSLGLHPLFSIFILQSAAYIGVSLMFLRRLRTFASKTLVFTAHIVLGANIFVAPYFSVTLTDSLYTSMALAMVFWAWVNLYDSSTPPNIWHGVLFFSLAVAIRPAAVWLIIPLLVTIFVLLRRGTGSLIRESALSVIALAPLVWQSLVNFRSFGKFTPLPVSDLGNDQIQWGVEYVKYSTWVGPGEPGNKYLSNSIIGPYDGSGLLWYIQNPLEAIQLVSMKLVGAFDFDYLVPYPNQAYEFSWITSSFSFLILLTSMLVLLRHSLGLGKFSGLGPRWFPFTVFISWASINLISALELRFTLPILVFLSLVSLWFPIDWASMGRRGRVFVGIYLVLGLAVMWSVAILVRSLAVSGS